MQITPHCMKLNYTFNELKQLSLQSVVSISWHSRYSFSACCSSSNLFLVLISFLIESSSSSGVKNYYFHIRYVRKFFNLYGMKECCIFHHWMISILYDSNMFFYSVCTTTAGSSYNQAMTVHKLVICCPDSQRR